MAQLPIFDSLDSKSKIFDHYVIETERDFNDLIGSQTEKDEIFRGCSEAKYKLFNTLQRYWIENQIPLDIALYSTYLEKLIESVKNYNERLFARFLTLIGPKFQEYAILSIVQHYGGNSPLLDFTERKDVALYFASQFNKSETINKHIDSYCSLYIIENRHVHHTNNFFHSLVKKFSEEREAIIAKAAKEPSYLKMSNNEIEHGLNLAHTEALSFIHFMNYWKVGLIADSNEKNDFGFGTRYNLNILIQQGVFLFNYHPAQPLEESLKEFATDVMKSNHYTDEMLTAYHNEHKQVKCYDINKTLLPVIHEYLESKNINKANLFPDIYNMIEASQLSLINEMFGIK